MAADDVESIETGYLHSTPVGDNALCDYARSEADSFAALARTNGGRVQRDAASGFSFADSGVATPFGNTVHLTKPIADDAIPALVETVHDFFAAAPGGPFLVFSPWPIADLARHGFHLVGHPPLMLRPPSAAAPSTNATLRIAPVESADQLADFEQTLVEAYPAPEMQPWQRGAFLRPELLETSWRLFVGSEGDRCVATAAAWLADTVAVVEMVAVRDECRGNGYGAAITAAATVAEPDRTAMLIASDLGQPVYRQLAYLPLLRYTLYVGMRGNRPAGEGAR
jgi:hypothetical protein